MSEFFISKNVTNMMKEPDPDSALESQVLAGTLVKIEKEENDYCYVQTPDLYHGWVSQRRLVEAWDRSSYESVCVTSLFTAVFAKADSNAKLLTQFVIGTRLCLSKEIGQFVALLLPDKSIAYTLKENVECWQKSSANEKIFEEKWLSQSQTERLNLIAHLGENAVISAKRFMGTPYLWGGISPYGMDCSGLTQLCYKLHGVQLLRDSYMQYDDQRFVKVEKGKSLAQAQLLAGDLVVFDIKRRGKVDHIGLACGDGTFIHCRGEMKDGGMVINDCGDTYYNDVYIGAARLSAKAKINIEASAYL